MAGWACSVKWGRRPLWDDHTAGPMIGEKRGMDFAPIALFVYNRPDHALRTLDALLNNPKAKDSDLFVFSDGPKNDEAVPMVERVRWELRRISGFRSVSITER